MQRERERDAESEREMERDDRDSDWSEMDRRHDMQNGPSTPEEPGNEASYSDWSDDWDETYLAHRRAHSLRPIDPRLDACYHAIFGVAAWDATLAANLQE